MNKTLALALVGATVISLAGCSDGGSSDKQSSQVAVTRDGGNTTPSSKTTTPSATSTTAPSSDSSQNSDSTPSASSTSSSESSVSIPSDDPSYGDPLVLASSINSKYASSGDDPRGGTPPASDTKSAEKQIDSFFKTYYTYDTKIDKTDLAGAQRAARYARSDLAKQLNMLADPQPDFTEAAKHGGYTTVSLAPSSRGQSEGNETWQTVCKEVTIMWHGDAGWKPPAPTKKHVCVSVVNGESGWQVTERADV